MAVTSNTHIVGGSGQAGPYSYSFAILADADVKVRVNNDIKSVTTHYTLDSSNTRITFVSGQEPSTGDKVIVYRDTDEDPINSTFVSGSTIRSNELNDNFSQLLYIAQESDNQSLSKLGGVMEGDVGLGLKTKLYFEGDTDNAYETTLTVVDPTADRTITFPNETGTVVTTGSSGVVTSTMITDATIVNADIANTTITGGKLVNDTITATQIAANAVTASELADDAVDRNAIVNDAVNGTKIADDSIDSEHYVDGSIDNAHLANSSVNSAKIVDGTIVGDDIGNTTITGAKLVNDTVTATQIAANAITASELADNSVDRAAIVNDAVDGSKIAANAITEAKILDGNISTAKIADNAILGSKIAAGEISGGKIAANAIDSDHYVDGSIDRVHLAADIVDGTKIADNAVQNEHITDDAIDSEHYVDGSIDAAHLSTGCVTNVKLGTDAVTSGKIAAGAVGTSDIADDAVTTAKLADAELTTLAGMQSGTASILADSTALTSTTAELNLLDGKSIVTSIGGSATDAQLPSAQAVNERIVELVTEVGGFHPVANETSFPSTNPDINDGAGTIVSVKALASNLTSNGSGVATIANGAGSGNTVTINGMSNSTTYAAGKGLILETTSTLHTYTFHRLVMDETGVNTAQTLVNDFNARYRVASSAPSSSLDDGDLYFDTNVNKMKVYNASSSTWDDVATPGDFYISTFSESFDGSRTAFTVSNAPTSAQQLIISVNGVVQKPNAGTGQPSEGFTLSGSTVTFSSAPASGSDYYVVALGSTVNIGTPSNNTVSTDKLQNLAVTTAKIAADAVDATKIGVLAANLQMADAARLQIGTGNDLEIYHDGTDSIIDNNTGALHLKTNTAISVLVNNSENAIVANANGSVDLYHNNVKKAYTWADGFHVLGKISGDDSASLRLGASEDLQIYHNGSQSYITNDTSDLYIQCAGDENAIETNQNAGVKLYYNGVKQVETDANGILLEDNHRITFGDSNDGDLRFKSSTNQLELSVNNAQNFQLNVGGEVGLKAIPNGAVELYFDNSRKLSTYSSGVEITGTLWIPDGSSTGNRISVGNSSDLLIYHDGSNSYIQDSGTGELRLRGTTIRLTDNDGSENFANFNDNGAVELYYDNSKKFETLSSGAKVWGDLHLTNSMHIVDSEHLRIGSSNDLDIYHNGTNSYIDNNTNNIYIRNNVDNDDGGNIYIEAKSGETSIECADDSFVSLYYDGSKKFETNSGGVEISGHCYFPDNNGSYYGASEDLKIYHNSSDSCGYINNKTNHLKVQTNGITRLEIQNDGEIWTQAHLYPWTNSQYNLGSSSYRWANLYVNDAHFSNEGSSNSVDGTWGDWTLQEGEEDIFMINNRSGKKYKMNLTEVS
tara:strand:- start:6845 stop:10936 length:4092 start_codon:yes stop_codon:yes gene_type:complete